MTDPGQIEITDALFSEAKRQGMSQTDLANKAGKDHNSIYLVHRNGNIGIHMLLDLVKVLGVKVQLVNGKGETILCL